ncbi:MAG: flavodoxin family protein [Bacteroidaceae bacterium]|nr:flavodoxin family protein [Bacteroidaceae bacterium]
MKILIINASPRSKGLISQMLNIMSEEAQLHHADVDQVIVNRLLIRPCIGCMNCRSRNYCSLPEDDAQRTLRKIEEADILIIGSPCYWGNMNGYLKVLFDRIVYGLIGENANGIPTPKHKGKKAVIVTTCSTAWPFNILFNQSRGAVKALREILKWSGFSIKGVIEKGGTRKHPKLTDKEIKKCQNIIRRILK